jgi:cytochrome c-type biogenesis protein
MDLVFAYIAGLLTLINPCVLPVLPIVLASALQAGRAGPLALAAGMSVSFVVLGLLVTAFGASLGLTPETLSQAGAVVMIAFGLVLLVPRAGAIFEAVTAGFAARADAGVGAVDRSGMSGQFIGGLLLGAVWSPCIGPTLGGAIALASQRQDLLWSGAIMVGFALGVSTLILGLGYGTRAAMLRRRDSLRRLALVSRPLLGAAFLVVGVAIFFKLHHYIEIWAINTLPPWLLDLSVRF